MSIKITRYVLITSGVIGATSVAQRALVGRRFTTDPRVPFGTIVSVGSGGADDYFGTTSPEAAFARQYFSYVSPAPVSQAQELQFAAYAPSGRGAAVFGDSDIGTLAELAALTAATLTVNLNGADIVTGAIDLSTATSYANVVTLVNAALAATVGLEDVTIAFSALDSRFTLSRATIEPSTMTVASDVLAGLLGVSGNAAIASPGVAPQTPLDAFIMAEQVTDSFGSASFAEADLPTPEAAVALATYVAGENVKYQLYVVVNRTNFADFSEALIGIQSVGLILNSTDGEYKEALPAAIMAATNYDRRNATVNYMFRQAAFTGDVTTDADANMFDAARVNYYGTTATAGQNISFFQRGYLTGGATAPIDMGVHANEQWLKAFLTSRFMSLQLSVGKIPANIDGIAMIKGQIAEGVTQAKFNGTISVGTDITAVQQAAIAQVTGDPLAWQDIASGGVWYDVIIVQNTGPSGATEYVAQYTLVYKKMDVVRRVDGSHNLV